MPKRDALAAVELGVDGGAQLRREDVQLAVRGDRVDAARGLCEREKGSERASM